MKRYSLERKKEWGFLRNPALIIVGSFFLLILAGTLLLMLPVMNRKGVFTPFINAMFTAASATCVTGLTVYDTYQYFNMAGQSVILGLIQLGGLGLVTLTSFFYLLIGRRMSLRTARLAQESVSSEDEVSTKKLLQTVVFVTLCVELAGALILSIYFVPEFGRYGVFMSVFLAISAYCNAGFDLLGMRGESASLLSVNQNPLVMLTLAALVICGGIGFLVWQDIWRFRKRRKLTVHSKIVLSATAILLAGGFIFFALLEWKNPRTLGNMGTGGKLLNAFFQSVTVRTAGFDSIGNGGMRSISKFISLIFMFIGAAPGSTGGGVKITTMVVLVMTVYSVMRGRTETIIASRRVDKMLVYKALAVLFLAFFLVVVTTGVILGSGEASQIDALFESVSAFATVGLSVGVSGRASIWTKILLIFAMFLGRVGPVSFALSISAAAGTQDKKQVIPDAKILVG